MKMNQQFEMEQKVQGRVIFSEHLDSLNLKLMKI